MAFPTTRWTLVRAAVAPAQRQAALGELLGLYQAPVYAYLRRRGLGPEDAEDTLQDVYASLLTTEALTRVDAGRGRLRSWLLGVVEHTLGHQRERASAQKRSAAVVPLDLEGIEAWLGSDDRAPEAAFHAAWADHVLQRAMVKLRAELEAGRRAGDWSVLTRALGGDAYRTLAAEVGMSVPQLKSFVHRSKARLRELALDEIRDTVGSAEEAESELRELLGPP